MKGCHPTPQKVGKSCSPALCCKERAITAATISRWVVKSCCRYSPVLSLPCTSPMKQVSLALFPSSERSPSNASWSTQLTAALTGAGSTRGQIHPAGSRQELSWSWAHRQLFCQSSSQPQGLQNLKSPGAAHGERQARGGHQARAGELPHRVRLSRSGFGS